MSSVDPVKHQRSFYVKLRRRDRICSRRLNGLLLCALLAPVSLLAADLRIYPEVVQLHGARAVQQIVVEVSNADEPELDSEWIDVTRESVIRVGDANVASVVEGGRIAARSDGVTIITVEHEGQSISAPLRVKGTQAPDPVSFRREVVAVFARHGCSSGACHGSPSGKNGFRLSLRGHDPVLDYDSLTREFLARRTTFLDPDVSLVLRKPLGEVPHQGGKLFRRGGSEHTIIRDWIREGLTDRQDAPLVGIDVFPKQRSLRGADSRQQLVVTAHFADGTRRDVTRLAVLTIDDTQVAGLDAQGLLSRRGKGEVVVLARYLDQLATSEIAFLPKSTPEDLVFPPERNYVDRHVFAKLRRLGISAARLTDDGEFIRRVYLDTIALLPSPDRVRAFVASDDPKKRARLIEELLARPEFNDFWALKWLDVLRSNRKTIGPAAVFKLQRWVRHAMAAKLPIDVMAQRLVLATGDVNVHPEANFYRVTTSPEERAETVSQLFLGIRIGCARCHNHPFERWTQNDYYGLASFFSGVRIKGSGPRRGRNNARLSVDRQVVWNDPSAPLLDNPRSGRPALPVYLTNSGPRTVDGAVDHPDRRELFAQWLTSADNPYFAAALANRIWYHILGQGIVDPVDDFRDSNPPSNKPLLDALATDLREHDFDLRHLVRTILNSSTYQLRASTNEPERYDRYFAYALPRRLSAEQLADAVDSVLDLQESYAGIPLGARAVQLPDDDAAGEFLKKFGKPQRQLACECERPSTSNFAQSLELLGGSAFNEKLRRRGARLDRLLSAGEQSSSIVDELYLAALARSPSGPERAAATALLEGAAESPRAALEDILWALLNSREFLFRR